MRIEKGRSYPGQCFGCLRAYIKRHRKESESYRKAAQSSKNRYQKEKYWADASFREKLLEKRRHRYHTDANFRQRRLDMDKRRRERIKSAE